MKIVLDTNVPIQILPRQSRLRPIWEAIKSGEIQIVLTTDIALEYEEILQQRTSLQVASDVMDLLRIWESVRPLDIYYHWQLMNNDPDDNKFADAYVAGNARYLVTNDRHFNHLQELAYPPIIVLSPTELLEKLGQSF